MLRTTPTTRHTPPASSGITLVEMLISMAVTLIMMAAVVNLFANIGAGVKKRNASMELGGQLRMARSRLFKDLAGATSAVRPKLPSDDHDDGYLEIIEGQWSDKNPSELLNGIDNGTNDLELDYAVSIVPSAGDPNDIPPAIATPGAVTNGGGLGDYDDILALTVRSESEPFVGRHLVLIPGSNPTVFANYVSETIESNLAEIVWYSVENPADGSLGEPGMRTVYRRVLLIAPWLQLPDLSLYNRTGTGTGGANGFEQLNEFYRNNDVSVRLNTAFNLIPNTLSDLTKRENRFGHVLDFDPTSPNFPRLSLFPHSKFVGPLHQVSYATPPNDNLGPLRPLGATFENLMFSGVVLLSPDRQGEDVMLNDALAFDLRVYDPGALLITIDNGPVLEPSDVGWNPSSAGVVVPVGYGAYVDLGWDPSFFFPAKPSLPRYNYNYVVPPAGIPTPLFKEPHTAGWHPRHPRKPGTPAQSNFTYGFPATYDTWPYHYENDGIDQEAIQNPHATNNLSNTNIATDNGAGVDQGTNGLDDLILYDDDGNPGTASVLPASATNGVDDPNERETAPPYDVPLRGLQVKLRIYDRDSRQIREATVTRNFVPQ